MEEKKFCTACGQYLEPGMQFCPQCGKVVYGSDAEAEFKSRESEALSAMKDIRRSWLMFFLLVYAVPVIIAGIWALVDTSSLAHAVWNSDSFQGWMDDHGHYSYGDVKAYIFAAGFLVMLSGICALVSCYFIYKRQKWMVAVLACIFAAILCFWSLFGMLIGFMVAWLIVDSKDLFTD